MTLFSDRSAQTISCVAIDSKMQLSPDTMPVFAVLFDFPFAFTKDLQSGGINHQTSDFTPGACILWSTTKETDVRRGRHCIFLMHVHLVFVAKYRRKKFDLDSIEKLRSYFASVCANFDVELIEMGGECDDGHLLINYPPKLAVSNLVKSLKAFPADCFAVTGQISLNAIITKRSVDTGLFCSRCVGAPISIIRQYIEQRQTLG